MEPDAVDDRLGEERIIARGHPLGQRLAAVLAGADRGHGGAEELRRQGLLAARLHLFAGPQVEDDFGAGGLWRGAAFEHVLLAADAREEGGRAVIVVLGPALEGMVVALAALHADAEEELGR